MRDTRPLTATSFAILGLLAIRPWRTYDLAKQVRRSLHHFWPRAESNLYAEAKRLVTGGYAVARVEQDGGRSRSIYMITPRGRKVLRAWLEIPGGETRLESEPLMKVFFADQGAKADLLDTIKAMGQAAEEQREEVRRMAEGYRVGTGPFPERLAIGVIAIGLVWDQLEATIEWSRRAAAQVEHWSGPGPGETPVWPRDIFSSAKPVSNSRKSNSTSVKAGRRRSTAPRSRQSVSE